MNISHAIILHGKPSQETYFNTDLPTASNAIWIPWLQKQLQIRNISTQTPEMHNAWQPDYLLWSREIERHDITEQTLLIGHSFGAGFILQWLSERPDVRVGYIMLVAPSFGDKFAPNTPLDVRPLNGFFNFELNDIILNQTQGISLFHSDNDSERVMTTVRHIREKLPTIRYKEFHNYGHFRGARDMVSDAFPELIEELDAVCELTIDAPSHDR